MYPENLRKRMSLFPSLEWPQQRKVLDELNKLSCEQEGRTMREANAKRAPIEADHRRLQHLHDQQVRAWVETINQE